MASEYIPINQNDTRKKRKELGLPVTKGLIYWDKEINCSWKQLNIVDYEVLAAYEPSGSKSILITTEDGKQIRILSDYLADMQKPSFLNDIGGSAGTCLNITGRMGQRIDLDVDTYVAVDLETTGTNHLVDEITEIGAIKYIAGKETERFSLFVKTNVEISKKVEKLTGISNDMLRLFGIEPREAIEQLRVFLGNSTVLGHNFTTFDSKFLEDAYVRELNCHFPNDYIDTLYISRKLHPDLKHHTLEALSEQYGIDYSKAHRAVEDCEINHLVYEHMTYGGPLDGGTEDLVLEVKQSTLDNGSVVAPANEDELVEIIAADGWQKKLTIQFAELENEYELMSHSFSIMANYGKDGRVSSYAVCVYEPDLVEDRRDSSRNTVLARVKEDILKSNTNIVEVYSKSFEDANEKRRFEKDSIELIECLTNCIRNGINHYIPKAASFACCSRFKECSDNKKCVHQNVLYAKACRYRKNLENGEIFY